MTGVLWAFDLLTYFPSDLALSDQDTTTSRLIRQIRRNIGKNVENSVTVPEPP